MKMFHKILALAAMVTAFAAANAAAESVSYTSVLSGRVAAVVPAGTTVHEGDVLVTVQSLAGPMAAARASSSGVVQSVAVAPGDTVAQGNVVVVVETK